MYRVIAILCLTIIAQLTFATDGINSDIRNLNCRNCAKRADSDTTIHRDAVYHPHYSKPVIFINGEEVERIIDLDRAKIERINLISGKEAINLVGERGESGVLLIHTIIGRIQSIEPSNVSVVPRSKKNRTIKIGPGRPLLPPPLIFVDGVSINNTKPLNPAWINNIDIIKGEEAKSKYGKKGENGVIFIYLKKLIQLESREEMEDYLASFIIYPKLARDNGMEGMFITCVRINAKGKAKLSKKNIRKSDYRLGTIEVFHKLDYNSKEELISNKLEDKNKIFENEIKRVIQKMPPLKKGILKNKTVELEVHFKAHK